MATFGLYFSLIFTLIYYECSLVTIIGFYYFKDVNLVLFDLDDTLLSGDTEGEWVQFMLDNGMIQDDSFLDKMSVFTADYRKGVLNIFDYSNFLLKPLRGYKVLDINELGVDHCFGTDPEIIEGFYTGKVFGHPNFSEEKVRRIKEWIEGKFYEKVYAYSDSIHDLALLEFYDFATVVNPDDQLMEEAKQRNWRIDISRL